MSYSVLVCDDSTMARRMAKRHLPSGFAHTIFEATNGVDALEVLAHNHVDLLILDLTMPIMDGVAVLEEIKLRGIKAFVVVVSGDIQPAMQSKVMSLGALGFIPKPLKTHLLSDILTSYGFIQPQPMVG
ncbi:response regulator [Alteromonas sp. KUL49]|uniref:response regulator n=1 Tax=Alteromonas sp. KUL49 TaxID=2480798 RepID=UPI00102ED8B6|nr:response regulator [Alteromonas sp. KUL49]TAP41647.1 response regulator [Alteromonas sp. KUL49]